MKKILLVLVSFTALLLAGCGPSPSSVVQDFFDAANEGDWETAQALSTGEANTIIGMAAGLAGDEKPKPEDKMEIEIVSEEVDGDTANVVVKNEDGKEATVSLRKVDGEWKIATLPKD